MIILSDANNNVVGSYLDNTTITNLTGVTTLPTPPDQQVGVNAVLIIDPIIKALSYKYVAIGATLQDVQKSKLAQIDDLYNKKLVSGFTSSATGAPYTFGYGQKDRDKFIQLAIMVLSNIVVWSVPIHTIDNKDIPHDYVQYTQLVKDIAVFAVPLDTKQHNYINRVNACTTTAQVNDIVVTF